MRIYRITPLAETKALYLELLAGYKSVGAKKRFLTRELKSLSSLLEDFRESLEHANGGLGWLHGERITKQHVTHTLHEIGLIKRLRDELDKPVIASI